MENRDNTTKPNVNSVILFPNSNVFEADYKVTLSMYDFFLNEVIHQTGITQETLHQLRPSASLSFLGLLNSNFNESILISK